MGIKEKYATIISTIPNNVSLIAVSKTKPVESILEVYNLGQRIFGENKVQELVEKHEALPKDIQWHLIGHLQTNKVKYIASFVSLIHSVDSLKLMKEINKHGEKNDRVIDCLLQFHIAEEETKFGLSEDEAKELLNSEDFKNFKNIRVCGVMGMATNTENDIQVAKEFKHLYSIFQELKSTHFVKDSWFKEISMGMSDDYILAIKEGSTMVRIGSSIFGGR